MARSGRRVLNPVLKLENPVLRPKDDDFLAAFAAEAEVIDSTHTASGDQRRKPGPHRKQHQTRPAESPSQSHWNRQRVPRERRVAWLAARVGFHRRTSIVSRAR